MAAQPFKSMAGAITVAEVITMDGVEVITMDGAIITIGETSLPSGNHSGRSRLSLAAFSFEPSCLRHDHTQKPPRFPSTAHAAALRLPGGVPRRAVPEGVASS
jgi:hypothetical protein